MSDTETANLARKVERLENIIQGLMVYIAAQAWRNGWEPVNAADKDLPRIVRQLLDTNVDALDVGKLANDMPLSFKLGVDGPSAVQLALKGDLRSDRT